MLAASAESLTISEFSKNLLEIINDIHFYTYLFFFSSATSEWNQTQQAWNEKQQTLWMRCQSNSLDRVTEFMENQSTKRSNFILQTGGGTHFKLSITYLEFQRFYFGKREMTLVVTWRSTEYVACTGTESRWDTSRSDG